MENVTFEGLNDKVDKKWSDVYVEGKLPPIPDGGWGWMVVFAAFIAKFCVYGLEYSFPLFFNEFHQYFDTSFTDILLIGRLRSTASCFAGLIMSPLIDRYGCRIMTITAGLMSIFALIITAVSNSLVIVCLTFGLMNGIAVGILHVTIVASVIFWFDKRRSLAVSLAYCGMRHAFSIYSCLTEYLLHIYDWRNTIVFLSGIFLHICVCGILMKNPEWLNVKQRRERKLSRRSAGEDLISRPLGEDAAFDAEELRALLQSGKSPEYILATLTSSIVEAEKLEATTQMNDEQTIKRINIPLPTFVQQNDEIPPDVIEKLMENKRLYKLIMQKHAGLLTQTKSADNMRNNRLCHNKQTVIDLKMCMFNLSIFIFSMWINVPFYYLERFMRDYNVAGAHTIMTIIEVACTIGMLVLGWAGDQPWVSLTKTYASCLIICGLSVAGYALLSNSYCGLTIVAAIFGLSLASTKSYIPVILLKLTPIDQFTGAFGLILMFQGLGGLFGTPIVELLRSSVESWNLTFYVAGLWLVISGCCVGVIPLMKKSEKPRSQAEPVEV